MGQFTYTVPTEYDGEMLQTFLRRACGLSWRMVVKLKRVENGMTVDGEQKRSIDRICAGQSVVITMPDDAVRIEGADMPLEVAYEEPDGTVIGPGEFVPLAEQTNMIAPITWFVLEEVCRFLREHPELDGVSVGVNLPMAQLLDNSVIVRINGILGQYGIDHSRIGLEFTECAILENFEQTSRVMWRFRNEGYRFYLDDFGEGYSNFNCLLQLPFQIIKLDKKLVRMELTANGDKCLGLTQRLISFLHERNLQVIAEGVENEEDAEKLRSQGVDRIQGYVYARPMPGEELLAFYREHRGLNGEEA